MAFPINRQRRLRRTEALRSFVRETRLTPAGFVYPLFICPGEGIRKPVGSMPGVFNLSVDEAVKECREVHSLGVPAIILFGLPETKDEIATGAWAEDGIVQRPPAPSRPPSPICSSWATSASASTCRTVTAASSKR